MLVLTQLVCGRPKTYPSLWKQTVVVPGFKKGSSTVVVTTDLFPYSTILQKFSNLLSIMTRIFKHKFNPSQHDFRKHSSTSVNVVTYVNTILHSVNAKGQTDTEYLNLSSAFNIIPQSLLLCKLGNFGLLPIYDNWFHINLTNRHASVFLVSSFLVCY
jgi:hypothetical protein